MGWNFKRWLLTCIIIKVMASSVMCTDHSSDTYQQESHIESSQDYDIVFPSITDASGNHISHNLHFHSHVHKRSTGSAFNNSFHVNISGHGQNFHIQLWENKKLLAPGFMVYYRRHGNRSRVRNRSFGDLDTGCHFTGEIKSHDNHPVSISGCDKMTGILRTAEEDYILEPLERQKIKPKSNRGHPHKLYKRSSMSFNQEHYCGKSNREKRSIEYKQDHTLSRRSPFNWKFHRHPKFAAKDKTVETLVVVDKNMFYKHGEENITTYTLTLFNMLYSNIELSQGGRQNPSWISCLQKLQRCTETPEPSVRKASVLPLGQPTYKVSQLYKDNSLGNSIKIVLVGLVLLEGEEPGLNIGFHADKTLNSFCSWQSVLVGANGRQHDHAILLTGMDLCSYKNAPCDTLGFAPIEGMCNRIRSCTINEDTGLSTAFTIAHEMGHNFGMFHDGEGNYCTQSAGKIMSPTLMGKDGQFHWSLCSKAYLMRFLNTPQSDCLADKPKHVAALRFPDKLPGELYDADVQCKWQFGHRAKLCTYDFGKDICKSLWCYRGKKRCETKFLPAAEGTSCGHGMWCRQGECVKFGNDGPVPINGGWSEWTQWSDCSRTCSGGVRIRERQCNRPLPQYGGLHCTGGNQVFKMCNVQDCPNGDKDFYEVQCSSYDKKPFRGWYLNWKPNKKLYNIREPCKLYCIAETYTYVFTIKHAAINGMKCMDDNNICVDGVCKPIGCDWIVGSNATSDICGVCNGDNSSCKLVKGEYTEQPKLNTYFPVAIIPKSARSIKIAEKAITSNYIAVRDIFGKYTLNGDHKVAWPGEYTLGGAKFYYRRPYSVPETLESEGPLQEDIVVEILVQDENPGVTYEYTVPKLINEVVQEPKVPKNEYSWSVSVSSCSEPCAGGQKTVSATCNLNLYEEVDPSLCEGTKKPETGIFSCNEDPCPPRWVPEEWRECTKKCGGGKQRRKIYCRQRVSQSKDRKLRRKFCKHLPKPIKARKCNENECPPSWHYGKWSKCSVSCGSGQKRRKVICRSKGVKGYKVMPDNMCQDIKPVMTHACKRRCPSLSSYQWRISPWGPCSVTCGDGLRKRSLGCQSSNRRRRHRAVKDERCSNIAKPNMTMVESCHPMPCPESYVWVPQWQAAQWSQCSSSCGEGKQKRDVDCVNVRGETTTGCDDNSKPTTSRMCNSGPCDPPAQDVTDCTDKYSWCHLVPEHNVCDHEFYGINCCKTCKNQR